MYLFPRFMDAERAEHIVELAKSRLAPSALALRKNDKGSDKRRGPCCRPWQPALPAAALSGGRPALHKRSGRCAGGPEAVPGATTTALPASRELPAVRRDVRTSQGTFLSRRDDKQGVLAWVEDKIASLTGIPASHGEVCLGLQLVAGLPLCPSCTVGLVPSSAPISAQAAADALGACSPSTCCATSWGSTTTRTTTCLSRSRTARRPASACVRASCSRPSARPAPTAC